ncbi:hypothetical protein QT231_02665 [Halomonas sp. SpR1]|uniref:hypothetical protein n=1 Tax=Halomonas sp. SpR1 TaxID=3050462 RepID=UPI0027E453E6|nr:hypothetical protein [Halomonas sp. SpR1]MDQ7731583.1 hypothetical protein [Halomonas sp. SpR1]
MSHTIRIHESKIDQMDQGDFHLIATVGQGEENYVGEGREIKLDKRLPPFVGRDHPGTDMTPKVLLIESDSPDDPATIQRFKDELGVYQPRKFHT